MFLPRTVAADGKVEKGITVKMWRAGNWGMQMLEHGPNYNYKSCLGHYD